ncbi:hypothetical protein, partial [Actinomadura opuntiae]|uniref:hypothetical protein n=1 Tax=Actinomadura sp. OS1-43 TaxID=604315 RepID=UPI00255A7471
AAAGAEHDRLRSAAGRAAPAPDGAAAAGAVRAPVGAAGASRADGDAAGRPLGAPEVAACPR